MSQIAINNLFINIIMDYKQKYLKYKKKYFKLKMNLKGGAIYCEHPANQFICVPEKDGNINYNRQELRICEKEQLNPDDEYKFYKNEDSENIYENIYKDIDRKMTHSNQYKIMCNKKLTYLSFDDLKEIENFNTKELFENRVFPDGILKIYGEELFNEWLGKKTDFLPMYKSWHDPVFVHFKKIEENNIVVKIIKIRKNSKYNKIDNTLNEALNQLKSSTFGLSPFIYNIIFLIKNDKIESLVIIMEYMQADKIDEFRLTSQKYIEDALQLLIDLVQKANIIHTDIHRDNFIVRDYDKKLFLIDFGISNEITIDKNRSLNAWLNYQLGKFMEFIYTFVYNHIFINNEPFENAKFIFMGIVQKIKYNRILVSFKSYIYISRGKMIIKSLFASQPQYELLLNNNTNVTHCIEYTPSWIKALNDNENNDVIWDKIKNELHILNLIEKHKVRVFMGYVEEQRKMSADEYKKLFGIRIDNFKTLMIRLLEVDYSESITSIEEMMKQLTNLNIDASSIVSYTKTV